MKSSFVVALPIVFGLPLTASLAEEVSLAALAASPHRVLFESYDNDNWDLCVMNADGSGRRNLTHTPDVHELYPQASPDGKRICFLVDVQKDGDTLRSVYYMNADGTGRTRVADKARQPCWSPDSTRIAFVPQEFSRFKSNDFASKGLSIYDLKTGKTTPHSNNKIQHLYGLNWSANGDWFVSTVHGGMGYGHAILAISAHDDRVYDLKIGGCRPCLSPDGTKITWSSGDHTISVADVDLRSDQPKVSNRVVVDKREKLHLYHPDFSPDGKYVTYSVGPGGRVVANGPGTHTNAAEIVGVRGKWDIYLKPITGQGDAIRLTQDESLSNKESDWLRASEPAK